MIQEAIHILLYHLLNLLKDLIELLLLKASLIHAQKSNSCAQFQKEDYKSSTPVLLLKVD
jgi:hypothetical protein